MIVFTIIGVICVLLWAVFAILFLGDALVRRFRPKVETPLPKPVYSYSEWGLFGKSKDWDEWRDDEFRPEDLGIRDPGARP